MKMLRKNRYMHLLLRWMTPFGNPIGIVRAISGLGWYVRDYRRYRSLPDAEPIHVLDTWPQLHDRTSTISVDAHYFYAHGWAMRRIVSQRPTQHVDISSLALFVNLLSAVLPVTFVDYRPLERRMDGLTNQGGDILNLPFADGSISSLSCLHAAEHIGLGRYGDPLNPHGTRDACRELRRVLAPGGNLYFAVPVGRQRVCFNAHRIHTPQSIVEYFSGLELVELCGVHSDGRYVEQVSVDEFACSEHACGMFWFRKPGHGEVSR